MTVALRIYADFNSVYYENGYTCWCLRYGPAMTPLDEVAEQLGLRQGMPVVLYYADESEEFEVAGVLLKQAPGILPRWHARADWGTRRQIRG